MKKDKIESDALDARFKLLVEEWNIEKNPLPFESYTRGSNEIVWWKCKKGHEWKAKVNDRTRGCGCPYCSNRRIIKGENDLQTKQPDLVIEWNYEKNEKKPDEYFSISGKKVWWKCKKGHEWQANISDRVRGNGCPYCANKKVIAGENDLQTFFPKVAEEWNYKKNEKNPTEYPPSSRAKVWWKCKRGHEWEAYIYSRTNGKNGCPYCAGQRVIKGENDLQTLFPEYAKEWDYEKNGELKPDAICFSSGKAVYWKCSYGHSWRVSPNSRVTVHSGCPHCSAGMRTSFPEQAIFFYCKKIFNDVSNRFILGNGQELDVYIEDIKFGIEYDGIRFHQGSENEKRERRKDEYCRQQGITMFHIKEIRKEVVEKKDNCIYRLIPDNRGLDKAIIELLGVLKNYIPAQFEKDILVDTEKDRDEILKGYLSVNDKMSEEKLQLVKEEWDYIKNNGLKPEMFFGGANKKFWWICPNGHSYYATMSHRTASKMRTGCPYCSNQKVLKGYNDLETRNPQLLTEWNYERNDLSPSEYTYKSYKKVWWKCKKGHEWIAGINKRANGRNCPICAGKKVQAGYNDLQTLCPSIASEWNYEKNGELKPSEVTKSSNKRVWWRCSNGHEWDESINSRTHKKSGCPMCRKK